MALSADLLRQLIAGLGDLYRPASSADYPAQVVSVVTSILSCDSCSYNHFGPAGPLAWHIQPAEVGASPHDADMFRQYLPQHPVLNYQRATGDGQARRISDFLSDRQFRGLGLYRDFYRHTATSYQAAISVPGPQHGLIGVAVNRQHRDFTDDETELLDLLRPHIQQATAICQALNEPAAAAPGPGQDGQLITPRQARILQLVAAGYPDKTIAQRLGISTRTVNAHLQNIYRTLDVTSRTEALARLGAISLPQTAIEIHDRNTRNDAGRPRDTQPGLSR